MPRDMQQQVDGDTRFMGIAPRLDPGSLPEGMASEARNMRFRHGVAETRKGLYKPGWANNLSPEIDSKVRPFGEIHGVGVFRNPNNLEFIVIAADNEVYYTRQNNNPIKLALPTGVSITGEVTFVQAFNSIMMFRGEDFAPLVMTSEDTGFADMVEQWDSTKSYSANDEVAFGPLVSVTGITHSNGAATVTTGAAHGYKVGADVTVSGANESEFNGRHSVASVPNTTSFTFAVTSGNSAATGTINCTNNKDYYSCTASTSAGESPSTTGSKWSQLSNVTPNASGGVFIANRIAAPTTYDSSSTTYGNKRDFVSVSDSLDLVHSYFNQVFRVNYGSDDEILDLLVYDENRLLVLKSKSVHMITGFIVDSNTNLGGSVNIQPVIQNYGVSGRGASVVVGSDVYFYASRRGVVSMAQTEQSKVRGVDIPLSEPIQPLIDRIDTRYEGKIRLAAHSNKLYVACPIDDGANGNNAILVYDFLNQSWASHDTGDAIKPKDFFIATYNNAQRLFMVGEDGYISLMEENTVGDDEQDTSEADGLTQASIDSYLLTRGYHLHDIDHRNFKAVSVAVSTWNPKYTLKAKQDGVDEEQTLVENRTKDRTAYYRPFDAEPWEANNFNEDFKTPYREDYSIKLYEERGLVLKEDEVPLAIESTGGILMEDGQGGFNLGTNGVAFDYKQETLERFALTPRKGRYTQLEISNGQGAIEVKQAAITTQSGEQTITVKS